jgi:methyl-accepting chemotaxis protein
MSRRPWRFVPSLIRNSYAAKLGLALALVLVVVSAVGGVVYAHTGDALETDTQRELETTATMEADRIGQWVRDTRVQQSAQANSRAFRTNASDEIGGRLSGTVDQDSNVKGAYHVNVTSGRVLDGSGHGSVARRGHLPDDVRDRVADRVDTPADVVTTDVFRPSANADPVFLFVGDVADDDHRAVVTVVDVRALSETTFERRSGSRSVVVDESGTVVLAHDESLLLTEAAIDPSGRTADSGFLTAAGRDGEQQAVGFAGVSSIDWVVTTRMPTAQAYALQTDISRGILAMILVAAGGAVAIGLTIGRSTVRSVRDLAGTAAELEDGSLDVDLDTRRTDEFGQLYAAFDSMRDSLRDQIREAERAREEADRRREQSERFARRLEATADEYGDVMSACAEGDLTRRMDPDPDSEAMATVAEEFNAMLDQLETTIASVGRFAEDVAVRSDQVTAGANDVRSVSGQVTESIQEISDGAERQYEQYQTVELEMQRLATSVDQVATAADDVAQIAEQTAETGREGRVAAEAAIDEMDAIESASRDAVAAIDDLQSEMTAIEEVVELITEMAEQTNLVALNASIEAARGSDAGEGFDVVAGEVRSLADETKAAAAEIEDQIETVRAQTERTASEIRAASDDIGDSAATVRDAADALEGVAEYAAETNEGVQEIRAATGEQATATEEVVSTVGEAATVSEETTAEAETVAAAAEEQTSTLAAVADNASGLADRADRLRDALDRFETRSAADLPETTSLADDRRPDDDSHPSDVVDVPTPAVSPE